MFSKLATLPISGLQVDILILLYLTPSMLLDASALVTRGRYNTIYSILDIMKIKNIICTSSTCLFESHSTPWTMWVLPAHPKDDIAARSYAIKSRNCYFSFLFFVDTSPTLPSSHLFAPLFSWRLLLVTLCTLPLHSVTTVTAH